MRRATGGHQKQDGIFRISIHALLAESDLIFAARHAAIRVFLSTLSLRRATMGTGRPSPIAKRFLSTLSLRRATKHFTGAKSHDPDFYPRSPCGERLMTLKSRPASQKFLSTLSLRRATPFSRSARMMRPYFYPRSPCGERHVRCIVECLLIEIFLSTLSLRRATPSSRDENRRTLG